MFLRSIDITNYLPFQHVGNKHVKIDFDAPATCILGGNGSGKSSLLRLLNPFPSIRTSFSKNGKISMVWDHDGHVYEIGSDFSSSTSPCFFRKDGTELNPGGTAETQKDLIDEHFRLAPIIHDLTSGKIQICSLQKAHRKVLFSSCYPSDLSFVLDYHKKVCSQIRAYANQLKLMQSREGTLRASQVDPAEIHRLNEYRDGALEIINRIDKANLLLDNEIAQLRDSPAMRKEYHPEDLDGIIHEFHLLRDRFMVELLDHDHGKVFGETIDNEHLGVCYANLNSELRHLEKEKETITTTVQEIRDELNKFSSLKFASTDDKKVAITNEIAVVRREIEQLEAVRDWDGAKIIPFDKLIDTIDLERTITDMLSTIHPYAGSIIGQEQIDRLRGEVAIAQNTMATLNREKADLTSELKKSQERLETLNKNSYPVDCERACPLRLTMESSLRDVRLRCDKIKERLRGLEEHLRGASDLIGKNQKVLKEVSPVLPVLKGLYEVLSENYLTEIALQDESFIDCLNLHCSEIGNRVSKGILISKRYHRYKNLKDRYDQLAKTLSMMQTVETSTMSAEVIDGIIADRERKVNNYIRRLNEIEEQSSKMVLTMDKVTDMAEVLRTVETLTKRVETCLNIRLTRTRIEFDQQMIREHCAIKNELNSRLREIEQTLANQKRIVDILETETLPQIKELREKKAKWEAVEQALSPSKGLPCIYLVRFINRLLSRANTLIKEVWDHDMELVYLKEEDDLDFTLQVMQNKSTIVSDISMCSKGEQAMINLAMILAVCIERGYLNFAPIIFDEIDAALTDQHRTKLVGMISSLLEDGVIKQMFLVNHYAIQTGLSNCDCVVLNPEGIVVPAVANEHALIE